MNETITINTYPIEENITVETVNDVTTIEINVVQSSGAVSSVNGQTGDVTLDIPTLTSDLTNDSGFITANDVEASNENVVTILEATPSNQFAYAHGTITIGSKMIIGTRQGANSKLLRYSGTTLEEVITVPCSLGLESIVKKSDESRIYGTRYYNGVSYIWDADPLDFTDINYNVITGVNLQDSPAICTDGTYIYGVENINNCKFFKVRISDWNTILTNNWTGNGGGHWCDINSIDGVFYASSSRGYLATVNNTNLTYTVNDVRNYMEVITDDNVFLPVDDNNLGYNAVILGGENKGVGTGLGAVIINVDDNTIRPFDILPTVGLFKSTDCTKLYSMSNQGFIQVWDLQSLLLALQSEQPYTSNTFTYRGNGFPNELLQPTDGSIYMTNWDTVNGTGMISKIELTPVSQPLITQKESYYNSLAKANVTDLDAKVDKVTGERLINASEITKLANTSGTNSGDNATNSQYSGLASSKQDVLTASNTHTFVDGLTAMTTPVDADRMIIVDNSVSLAKKITWANIKATLKTYFDSIYTTTSAVATQITTALSSYATTSSLTSGLATKQDTLVSGTNIKTVNSTSLLGSGNVSVEPTITAGTTSQYYRGDKSWQTLDRTAVGLGTVDYMRLLTPYVLSNSTSLQKMFNVGSGGGGSFNASANKTYRFRIEFDVTGLSGTSGTISFGFLGTAVITSISYKMNATKNALATITAANIQSIQTTGATVVTTATTNTVAKGMLSGTITVTTAGTIQPAIATSIGVTTAQIEANSFCEFIEIGSNTLTATSNIS
ncbi:MAG: hypothetical protein RLZZ605_1428 [Bacteroidota bacterium]|jgi:hypothetical protein